MNTFCRSTALTTISAALMLPAAFAQQTFMPPTPEELSMTSLKEVPGAPAVYLYLDQTTDDHLRMFSFYVRLKVLTEGGKEYANVEIPFSGNAGIRVDEVSGRTIHPDGSITPFTGKPYEKLVEKVKGFKLKEKVFTMPAVEVGSILEYRYKLHYDDSYFMHPDWYIQNKLFIRKAHYSWKPNSSSNTYIVDAHGQTLGSVAWTPLLPPGAVVKDIDTSTRRTPLDDSRSQLVLDIENVPPLPHEEFMPPMDSLSYRVLFYYTSYRSPTEYWTKEGKYWTKDIDKFVGPGPAVGAAVKALAAAGDTEDQRLEKIYNSVQSLENTDFTRQRSSQEEKAAGLKEAKNTDDVLNRKRGTSDELAELFVAMARAAGFKAYVMAVTNRNRALFIQNYLSMGQLDDYVAIVNLGGKEVLFDPGQRYCEYKRLAWKHTYAGGLRQTDGGVTVSATGASTYRDEHTKRVADLTLDEQGVATGTITLTHMGDAALHWRQEALRGDDTSLNEDLKSSLEAMLPGGMDVRVLKVENLTDQTKPLLISYEVKGAVGAPTGKRLLVPANLFEANSHPHFPGATRELAIDMHYPTLTQDAVRYKFPASVTVESAPASTQAEIKGDAVFSTSSKVSGNSITFFRNVSMNRVLFLAKEYPDLRSFYSKLEAKDQEPLVLTHAAPEKASVGGAN